VELSSRRGWNRLLSQRRHPIAEPPAKPRKRRSSAEVAAEKAAAQQAQQTLPLQQETHTNGNGAAAVDKPNVVSASPKLEQLLSSLAPRKE
jgi:hypothetical protein